MIGGMFYSLWLLIGIWFIGDHSQKLQSHTSCGFTPIKPDLSQNVSQTHDAVPYSWPWMVLVCEITDEGIYNDDPVYGTVVGSKWILTFGTGCLRYTTYTVIAGLYDKTKLYDGFGKVYPVKNVFCNYGHSIYTIMMLELHDVIEFDYTVQPVCLALPEGDPNTKNNNISWITGWTYDNDGSWYYKLRQAKANEYVSSVYPEGILYIKRYLSEDQFYYGSPLMRQRENKRWYQHGIWSMSFGATKSNLKSGYRKSIANDEKIEVYTRTDHHCPWIRKITHGEVLCS